MEKKQFPSNTRDELSLQCLIADVDVIRVRPPPKGRGKLNTWYQGVSKRCKNNKSRQPPSPLRITVDKDIILQVCRLQWCMWETQERVTSSRLTELQPLDRLRKHPRAKPELRRVHAGNGPITVSDGEQHSLQTHSQPLPFLRASTRPTGTQHGIVLAAGHPHHSAGIYHWPLGHAKAIGETEVSSIGQGGEPIG
jgi:hypothetical protein